MRQTRRARATAAVGLAVLALFGALTQPVAARGVVSGDVVETDESTENEATLQRTVDEVIVVTATRIEESLQDVPMSISATTGADLEQRAINNLSELSRWTPGLTVVDQGARSSNVVIVRGLHTAALNGSGSGRNDSVASYLGDIPLPVDLRLQDIERVEVLLGPQGTLYGAGTLAGAVRYLPRRPDPGERTFEIRGDLFALEHGGSPGNDAGITFNLPLAPGKLALRGSVDRFHEPGFIDYDFLLRVPGVSEPEPDPDDPAAAAANLRSEPDANTEETISARFSLLWQPTPDLSATLAYHLQDRQVGGRQVNHARSFDTGPYVSAHRYPEPNERRDELLSLELAWKLRSAELSSAIGYSRSSSWGQSDQTDLLIQEFGISGLLPNTFPALVRAREVDPDVTVNDLTSAFRTFSAYARGRSRRERFNWETRLAATGDGPWRWVGGVFLNRRDSRGAGAEYAPGLTEFSGVVPIFGGAPASEPIEYYSVGETEIEERALFGEISRDLGRRWRVLAGGRWFGYDVRTANLTEFPYTPAYNSPYSAHESEDRGVLFKGSLSYRLSDRTNLYFTRSEGYRIGGGNNFRVCSDEEIALLTDDDPTNDPPQSGCIYAHQGPDPAGHHAEPRDRDPAIVAARQRERHRVSRRLDGHPGGRRHSLQFPGDHAERRRRNEPRRGTRRGRQPDERVPPARLLVVRPRGTEQGLAGHSRRRRRRLRGRPPLGRARAPGRPARLLVEADR